MTTAARRIETRNALVVLAAADHAAGNYRILMNLSDELLSLAADRDLARLDEKLFLEAFARAPKQTTA